MPLIQPPPTYALPILVDENTGQATFNPIWLKWFIDFTGLINAAGGTSLASIINQATPVLSLGGAVDSDGSDDAMVIPGPQGLQGPEGARGAPGADGDWGEDGFIGPTGLTGAQGPVGPAVFLDAEQGESGMDGIPGSRGQEGATGSIGPAGPAVYLEAEAGAEGSPGNPAPQSALVWFLPFAAAHG